MKRYSLQLFVVVVVLTLVAAVAAVHFGRVQSYSNVETAGDGGGPIPTCRPGTNCNPDDQVRQMAGDGGGPIPTYRPGTNCDPNDELRLTARRNFVNLPANARPETAGLS